MLRRSRVSCSFLKRLPVFVQIRPHVPSVLPEKDVYRREKKQQNYYDESDAYSNLNLALVGGREKTPQKLRN